MNYQSFENDSVTPALGAPFFEEHLARYLFASKYAAHKSVLELGCGHGYGAYLLAQSAQSVLACDLNSESLNFARTHYAKSNLEFIKDTVIQSSGQLFKYELVISLEVLEHIQPEETSAYLTRIRAHLAPGGRAIISTPNHEVVLKSGMPIPIFHINNFSSRELKCLLEKHFTKVEMFGQIQKQGALGNTLYYLDRWNLRHSSFVKNFRKIQTKTLQTNTVSQTQRHPQKDFNPWKIEQGLGGAPSYQFSKNLWRQAGMTLAVCS